MSAILQASINGGANASGGLTASDGDTVQLSGVSTVGWSAQRFEIYAYPVGFAVPAGWSVDGTTGAYFYSSSPTCPPFAVSPWGKYLFRLTVDNGLDGRGIADPSLVDEVTAVEILSPSGLHDLAWNEGAQFGGSKKWVADQAANLRITDAGLGSGAVPNTRTLTAGAGLTGGGNLTANRTFDVGANADGSIVVNANDIQVGVLATNAQHGNRGGGALHADATTLASGFMSAAHYTLVNGATDAATANAIAKRDGAGDCSFENVNATSARVGSGGIITAGDIGITPHTYAYAATITMRGIDGGHHEVVLTGNVLFAAPTNFNTGSSFEIFVTQGGAGHYVTSWATGVGGFYFPSGMPGTTAGNVGDADYYRFKHRAYPVSHWVCVNHVYYSQP